MRKSQNTSISERSNVKHDMWRKKVDKSMLRGGTAIPKWIASKWNLEHHFPDTKGRSGKNDIGTRTKISFNRKAYEANLTCTFPKHRANKVHRLVLSIELIEELQKVFLMSHMRTIESELKGGDIGDLEKEIPFWEFIDIEFNAKNKEFIFTAHYKQEPMFPELFKRLAGSPSLKVIQDEIFGKDEFRIHKQDWKPKEDLDSELGAMNVIYTLLDKKNKLIYVGEAIDLKKRLKGKYPSIPNWTHYRYEVLPKSLKNKLRITLERMVIRSYASLIGNKSKIPSANISSYKLANDKIDK